MEDEIRMQHRSELYPMSVLMVTEKLMEGSLALEGMTPVSAVKQPCLGKTVHLYAQLSILKNLAFVH